MTHTKLTARTRACLAGMALGLALMATGGAVNLFDTPAAQLAPMTVEEDSPLWDCTTMGNRLCGPR